MRSPTLPMPKPVLIRAAGVFHRHKESAKGENSQNDDVKEELESLTCDDPFGNWNAHDVDEDTGIFPFSPTAFDVRADNNLAAKAPPHEADMLGTERYRHPTQSNHPMRKFRETHLTTIAEESEQETGEEGGSGSNPVESSAANLSFADLLRKFQKRKLVDLRNRLKMIQDLGWGGFWMKAERHLIPADIFATIIWMAEVLRTFGAPSQLTSANLLSVQLSLTSLELALQYSRDAQTVQIIARIWNQLQNILSGAGITEVEFLAAVARFAAVLDDIEDGETLSQVAYWFGHRGEYRALLISVVPVRTGEGPDNI